MENIQLNSDYKTIIDSAVGDGVRYIKHHTNIKSLVLGISGGVDSAVVAALARMICDKVGGVRLVGFSLPIITNTEDEIDRARDVGETYCDNFSELDLSSAFQLMVRNIDHSLYLKLIERYEPDHDDKVRLGNIKARLRMTYLYDRANKYNGIVLSTDNLTEYNLGFWTLHGDVGDLGLIQQLWKTEVYGIADLLHGPVEECINAIPTDGLGITESDIDQILPDWDTEEGNHREAYKIVDEIIIDYISGQRKNWAEDHPVIQRHKTTAFKRLNPVNIKRDILLWRHNNDH